MFDSYLNIFYIFSEREHIDGLFDELKHIKEKLHHLNVKLDNVSESVRAARVNNVVINVANDETTLQSTTETLELMSTKSETEWEKWATVEDEDFVGMPEVNFPNGTVENETDHEILIWLKANYLYVSISGAGFLFVVIVFCLFWLIQSHCRNKKRLPERSVELATDEKQLLDKGPASPFEPREVQALIAESAV